MCSWPGVGKNHSASDIRPGSSRRTRIGTTRTMNRFFIAASLLAVGSAQEQGPCAPTLTNATTCEEADTMIMFTAGPMDTSLGCQCCFATASEPLGDCLVPVCADSPATCTLDDVTAMMQRGTDSASPDCWCCVLNARANELDAMEECYAPVMPPVDFCVNQGDAANNPDGALAECRHQCDALDWYGDAWYAAGCDDENHADKACVVSQLLEPGEHGTTEICCWQCEDTDGDGSINYEGCCDADREYDPAVRSDGQPGCERRDCFFACGALGCSSHETQTACDANNGTWTQTGDCAEEIASQAFQAFMMSSRRGMPEDSFATLWLEEFGEVCCSGYEPPGPGSCNGEEANFVSEHLAVLAKDGLCAHARRV